MNAQHITSVNSAPTEIIERFPTSGDHHHFVLNENSQKLIIFFTATGAAPKNFNWWGAGNELANEANILFVNGWSNSWYQDGIRGVGNSLDETIENLKGWQTHNRVTQVFCTGQSMGGHGALLFSALLGAKAIAFGAETVLGLPHSQYARKANKDVPLLYPDLPKTFKGSLDALLLAGERDPVDIYCASKMLGMQGVEIKTMRAVGHGPAGHLKNRDRLVPLLREWINGRPLPIIPEEGFALSHPEYPELFYKGWCALRDNDTMAACNYLARAVELYPSSDEARLQFGTALILAADFNGAFEQFSASYALSHRKESLTGAATALRLMGAYAEATYTHHQVLKVWPDHAAAWFSLGLCYLKQEKLDAAIMKFRQAVKLSPNNANYSKRLSICLKKQTQKNL